MARFMEEMPVSAQRLTDFVRPEVPPEGHWVGAVVSIVEDHHGRPILDGEGGDPVMQSTVHMHIGKAIAADQDRVCLVNMANQCRVKRVEGFD